ncbi:uncharacterized protein V1510DRAFT_414506 [Dipodascopsis tothii]|uniref:uncharacterized protein n=1 Tax=Dipodascopsis tothii TaxID=44089 RepID=UPI0034CFFC85
MSTALNRLRNSYTTSAFTRLPAAGVTELYELSAQFFSNKAALNALDPGDLYGLMEHHFYLALITKHDDEAGSLLRQLSDRFGASAPRVSVLRSLHAEATEGARAAAAVQTEQNASELGMSKRKVQALKSSGPAAYIGGLRKLLDIFPADAESWAELAQAYRDAGMYAQALYALDEVILLFPSAYNMHALAGEVGLEAAAAAPQAGRAALLETAVKHSLRAAELCDDYVRGWAGALVGATRAAELPHNARAATFRSLAAVAKKQLTRIAAAADVPAADRAAANALLAVY